jgi:glycosyltransferase involved in cell wall biosynthesis
MSDISVVVCTKNAVDVIDRCLSSIAANNPKEIIVVDGLSTDGTLDIVKKYTSKILSDGGKGIVAAANMGIEAATGRYVAFVGPDNIVEQNTLDLMIAEKERMGWVGVSAMTRFLNPINYVSRCMDKYKALRYFPGVKSAIGTPFVYDRTVLTQFKFDSSLTVCGDSDVAERLADAGFKVGISNVIVYETGTANMKAIVDRWLWYGQSDAEFWNKYSGTWGISRKILSLTHPLRNELVKPALSAGISGDFSLIPFLVLITVIRYWGWLRGASRPLRISSLAEKSE